MLDLDGLIDIKSLYVFDLVMQCKSQTKAAEILGREQSTINYYIAKLRDLTKDPLFEKTPAGFLPTARAVKLHETAQSILRDVQQEFYDKDVFQLGEEVRRYNLVVNDVFAQMLLPTVLDEIASQDLKISLSVDVVNVPINDQLRRVILDNIIEQLGYGGIDLFIAPDNVFDRPFDIKRQKLLTSEVGTIYNRENLELYGGEIGEHIDGFTSVENHRQSSKQTRRKRRQIEDNKNSKLSSNFALLSVAKQTLNQVNINKAFYSTCETDDLAYLAGTLTEITSQYWHSSRGTDSGHTWLRRYIQGKANEYEAMRNIEN